MLWNVEGVAGVNGIAAPSSGGSLTAGYPVQPTTHLATHPMNDHAPNIAPQFAGNFYILFLFCIIFRGVYAP